MTKEDMIEYVAENGGQFFYITVGGEIGECSYMKDEKIEAYKAEPNLC